MPTESAPVSADKEIFLQIDGVESSFRTADVLSELPQLLFAQDRGEPRRGDLEVRLKQYCRIVHLDGQAILYDSLNLNTVVLSPLLAQLLEEASKGARMSALFQAIRRALGTITPESAEAEERALVEALIILVMLRTVSVSEITHHVD